MPIPREEAAREVLALVRGRPGVTVAEVVQATGRQAPVVETALGLLVKAKLVGVAPGREGEAPRYVMLAGAALGGKQRVQLQALIERRFQAWGAQLREASATPLLCVGVSHAPGPVPQLVLCVAQELEAERELLLGVVRRVLRELEEGRSLGGA